MGSEMCIRDRFRGLHSPGVRKHGQIIFACYFRKSSIVCGGLNARTGSKNGTTDMLTDPLCTNSECFHERKSRDSTKNVFGNQLIDFCSMFNCSIVNGLCDRVFDDGFTYISSTGSSVIDYIIMSNDLFSVELVSSFEITSRVESSHLPVSIYARANRKCL